jgi:hypothetical protein
MDAIFAIQDEIVAQVVGAISTQIDKVLLAAGHGPDASWHPGSGCCGTDHRHVAQICRDDALHD